MFEGFNMAIGKKIVDVGEFGYNAPVVFKELTLGDAADISAATTFENKHYEGNIPEAVMNMIILEKLIESAPFPHDREGLRKVPLTMAIFLIEEAESMLDPLLKRRSKDSNSIIAEVSHQPQA